MREIERVGEWSYHFLHKYSTLPFSCKQPNYLNFNILPPRRGRQAISFHNFQFNKKKRSTCDYVLDFFQRRCAKQTDGCNNARQNTRSYPTLHFRPVDTGLKLHPWRERTALAGTERKRREQTSSEGRGMSGRGEIKKVNKLAGERNMRLCNGDVEEKRGTSVWVRVNHSSPLCSRMKIPVLITQ